jgi:hypothetical protein
VVLITSTCNLYPPGIIAVMSGLLNCSSDQSRRNPGPAPGAFSAALCALDLIFGITFLGRSLLRNRSSAGTRNFRNAGVLLIVAEPVPVFRGAVARNAQQR